MLINDHIVFVGDNVFYKKLHEKDLDIFGPTIHTWWSSQNDKLKDDLMNHMFNLFGDTFNRKGVTAVVGLNLNYVMVDYRDNLQINPKYECPSMVPHKEWKALVYDEKDKALRKQGKTQPLSLRRYDTYHIFNEKCSIFFTFKYI